MSSEEELSGSDYDEEHTEESNSNDDLEHSDDENPNYQNNESDEYAEEDNLSGHNERDFAKTFPSQINELSLLVQQNRVSVFRASLPSTTP